MPGKKKLKIKNSILLLGAGLFASPAGPIGNLIGLWPLMSRATLVSVTEAWAPTYRSMLAPLVAFEIVGNFALAALGVTLFVLFLRRHHTVPRLTIVFLVGHLTYALINRLGVVSVPAIAGEYGSSAMLDIVGKAALCALLLPYLENSTSVQSYFTRGRKTKEGNAARLKRAA